MRLQGVQAFGCARSLRPAANHEHRLRCRPYLPGPTARLSDRHRADHLGRPPRLPHAGAPKAGSSGRLGSRSDSTDPRKREAGAADGGRSTGRRVARLMMASESRARIRLRLADAVLPVGSLLLLAAMLALILSAAGNTLGYDFEAYAGAARRLINGERLYDAGASAAGGFGIYLYPPPFAVAIAPLLLLPDAVARWVWVLAMGCCLPLGANLMPVRRDVSWTILYSVKLGQVGPLLFVLFAVAWRWRDRATPLGISIALGALVKVQPAILVGWALAADRRPRPKQPGSPAEP